MQHKPYKFVIAGGGTGGHVFPAIAIAKAIKRIAPDSEILFFGAIGKMEMEKVPNEGFKIIGLPISGLQRKLSARNLLLPFRIIKSLIITAKQIKKFKPDAVVGVGGYASAPVVFVSSLMKIPILLQEQNSFPGLVNRLFGKKVSKVCVAYDGMEKFFPKEKILLCGNPVRPEIKNSEVSRSEALSFFNLSETKKTLLVVGGSLGALTINKSISNSLETFKNLNIQLIWQTGKTYYEIAVDDLGKIDNSDFKCFKFIEKMDMAYAACDLIISRAGAIAVSELCIVGKPVILIPSPNVTDDHQTKNALSLFNVKAALMIKDSETFEKLAEVVAELLDNEIKQKSLRENISKIAYKNADEVIANELINLIKKKK